MLLSATPQFTVIDLVRTAEYYRDVLGFEIAGYWDGEQMTAEPAATPPYFAIVSRDDVQIFLNRADGTSVRTGRSEVAYDVYFSVTEVDRLARELREHGADILDGPEDRVYGQRELIIRECNGLIFAFAETVRRG